LQKMARHPAISNGCGSPGGTRRSAALNELQHEATKSTKDARRSWPQAPTPSAHRPPHPPIRPPTTSAGPDDPGRHPALRASSVSFVASWCAGINRHGTRNGKVRRRRASDPRWPRAMRWRPQGRGRSVGRGRAGRAIEPRNQQYRGAHTVTNVEGNTASGARREPPEDPARSENHGTYASSMRENRESPLPPVPDQGAGRSGKAKAVSPR
jgi:hypothetical protein